MEHQPHMPPSPPAWLADAGMHLTLSAAAETVGSLCRAVIGYSSACGERICNDTRILQPGDVFIALAGRVNGHKFVPQALARGAAFAIVSEWPLPLVVGPAQGVLVVRDVDAALVELTRWHRAQFNIPIVGVGGGVGKTTTKETIAALLAQRHGVTSILKTPANWNDLRGICLTLLGLRHYHHCAIIEMGMDRPGEVAQFAALVRQQIGVVTAVSATHLTYFSSMADLVATERAMVETLPPNGVAILNSKDRLVRSMIPYAPCPVMTFGPFQNDTVYARGVTSLGAQGLSFLIEHRDKTLPAQTTLVGRHLITSALAAISVALADGWTLPEAVNALAHVVVPQRMRFVNGPRGSVIIDDTYNASPESMFAALNLLTDWPRKQAGKRIALLGDMRELGPRSQREHLRLGRRAAACCSELWLTGDERETIAAGAREAGLTTIFISADPLEIAAQLARRLQPNDLLLVKASHAVGLERIIPLLAAEG
ncbi:MAG: UDP-N-acetylmuramoyl-tripeptide--D-alanyl-D-alanine ligase [Ktedonobacteraceae bacterium]